MMTQDKTLVSIEIFPWNENFETGIDRIDEQHRKLVALLNRLAMHFANRSGAVELNATFKELASYADYHFRTEEAIWSQHLGDDDAYRKHLASHHSFIGEVTLMKENQAGKALDEVIYDIVSFLSKWLAYHILESDKRLAKVVIAMEGGASLDAAKRIANDQMNGAMKVLVNTVLKMYESLSTSALTLMREKALRKQAEEELSRSEERWQVVLEGGVENVWDWDIEKQQVTYGQNELPLFEVVGRAPKSEAKFRIHPADLAAVQHDFEAHMEGRTEFYSGRYRVLRDNGSWAWFLSRGKVVSRDAQGHPLRMVGTHSDITERELASQIFQNSNQAMLVCDMNNKIIGINPAFTKITGYREEEVLGEDPKILSSGQHDREFFRRMWRTILEKGHWRGELYNRRKNGELFPELLMINTVKDEQGHIDHYFAIFDDITEKKRADELIFEQANFDPLTKLPNRRMFLDRLQHEIRRSSRSGIPFALLFIDIDHFKDVNDTLGHDVGDAVLVETAQRIGQRVRESDTVSHLGGDKFVLIMGEVKELSGLEETAEGIIDSFREAYYAEGNQIHLSATAGIALYPYDAVDAGTLLKHAEQAMYLAKRMGRNRYGYFTPAMQAEAQKRRLMLGDLHNALTVQEFEVYYQPIVDLKRGTIMKAEALLRWNHPKRGVISPETFIPLAEESGLIVEIGDWVYREATRQAQMWQQHYDPGFQISINKSPMQFRAQRTVDGWITHLREIGLSGANSVIEITESFLMENEGGVAEKLSQLREEGFEISLDDFGTGYSSLSYLQKFPIDYVKIDKSFVSNLSAENNRDATLCEAIVTMAHKLGIKVIAEGVETEYQRELLHSMECDFGQGYLFSRPVPAEAFEQLLRSSRKD